ncbi:MAG: hypothetical protein ACYDHP_02855 [Ferrimicrobium sp.]
MRRSITAQISGFIGSLIASQVESMEMILALDLDLDGATVQIRIRVCLYR